MKALQIIALLTILLHAPAAMAQDALPKALDGELFPGFGLCTEREEKLLDRASAEYANITYPKKRDKNHTQKAALYHKKMAQPGIMERLIETYIKCDRQMEEFFPPAEVREKLEKQYLTGRTAK